MRRIVSIAAVLVLLFALPVAAQAPQAPVHAWLFGGWIGGAFPPPVTLSTQECLSEPTVIFTRDVVMHVTTTTPIYVQRLIQTVRATNDGFVFQFNGQPPSAQGGMLVQAPTPPELGFGCASADGLTVQRRGDNQIVFPGCSGYPYPLIRCAPR
jgi:hypothetical protein